MELSPRKRAVLAAVAKAYIKTGEPVGSKTLAAMLKNAPSSATLRSEMSELCELGLLAQPHTSAGRVPTSRGLKTYVDSLMSPDKISEGDKAFIDRGLSNIHAAPEKIPEIGGELLHRNEYKPGRPQYIRYVLPDGRKRRKPPEEKNA